jgi:hypothetical protein
VLHPKKTRRPSLEGLESRWVPATIKLVAGGLYISNLAGGTGLTVAATATPGKFTVTDNGKAVTVSGVGGLISITGTNLADKVTIALGANKFGGNLLANLGNGNDKFSVTGTGGTLGGSLTVLSGLGNDTVSLNAGAGAAALRVGGSAAVTDAAGANKLTFGNGAGVTTVGGDLTVTGFGDVQLDQGKNDFVGRDVNISVATNTGPLDLNQGNLGGSEVLTVGGSFNITGGPLSDDVALRGLNIGGDLSVSLGGATGKNPTFPAKVENRLAVSSSAASVTLTSGSLRYTGGSGTDEVDLRGGVTNGDVTLNLGDGNDGVLLASFGAQVTTIGGDLTVNGGNGNIEVGSNGPTFPSANTAVIGGNANFNLGNGNNFVSFNAGGSVGGTINYLSGNGNNQLLFAGDQTYVVNVRFGSGDDTVTLNNAALVLTGFLDGGAGSNTLTQMAGTLSPTLILVNF